MVPFPMLCYMGVRGKISENVHGYHAILLFMFLSSSFIRSI
jgi:hypothetical protein